MAIVIPSKNIYQKENPKVRDNVIERIEVNAVEVVPDNEYETPVYNENITFPIFTEENTHNLKYEKYTYSEEDSAAEYEDYIGIYAGITAKYTNIDISIPKLSNNKLISNLLLKKDNESKIGINLICEVRYYSVTADYNTSTNTISNIQKTENEQKRETKHSVNIQEVFSKQNGEKGYLYFSKTENKYGVFGGTVSIETEIKDNNNILSTTYEDENKSYEIKDLKILSGATSLGLSGHSSDYDYIPLTGEEVDYTPIELELTIYGNTIGIDLVDKTVYINGETAKKVHSVDGNELMQTTNYIKDTYGNANAIEKMYGDTQLAYSRGKETATIRCSISDYYDYDTDEKLISVDNSTKKMSFKIGDKVIPMVYTNNGDKPMSLYKDGTPKIFQVLGSKIYYDGAVWQELSLQEFTDIAVDVLNAPTISLDGSTLTMTATDERTETFAIFVDGVEMATAKVEFRIINPLDGSTTSVDADFNIVFTYKYELTDKATSISITSQIGDDQLTTVVDHDTSNIYLVGDTLIMDIEMDGAVTVRAKEKTPGYSMRATLKITFNSKSGSATDTFAIINETVCFAAGTLIKTPTGYKAVELIEEGDKVCSYNFVTEQVEEDEVLYFHLENGVTTLKYVTFDNGTRIGITDTHALMTEDGWKCCEPNANTPDIEKLSIGDNVQTQNGYTKVFLIESDTTPQPVYHIGLANGICLIVTNEESNEPVLAEHCSVEGGVSHNYYA